MKAIIAAGGRGSRLYPLTFTNNKHLIPIANKPLLFYPIEDIAEVGIKQVGIIVNETRSSIENAVGSGKKWGLKITYIDQPEPLGIGHVVKISENFLQGEPFVYHLGDNIFTNGIKKPFDHFATKKPDAVLTIIQHDENFRLGVPYFDKSGKLEKVVEKPKNPPNSYGVPGLYFFNHHVFEAFHGKEQVQPSIRGEYEVPDLYSYLIEHGYQVDTAEIDGQWIDPGKFDDSLEANRILLDIRGINDIKGIVDKSSTIQGKVAIGKGSNIVNSRIYGPATIGEHVHIENAYIGPYTSIANGCEIRSATIEDSILMERVDITDVKGKIVASMIGKDATVIGLSAAKPIHKLTISDMSVVELSR